MAATLSISNPPALVVDRLRRRAALHHRSLESELLAIVEAVLDKETDRPLSALDVLALARSLGTGGASDSTEIVRASRDRH